LQRHIKTTGYNARASRVFLTTKARKAFCSRSRALASDFSEKRAYIVELGFSYAMETAASNLVNALKRHWLLEVMLWKKHS
jgi:hypothetical protein